MYIVHVFVQYVSIYFGWALTSDHRRRRVVEAITIKSASVRALAFSVSCYQK